MRVSGGGWLAAGCTKPNPKSCQDGTCTDPGLPFCDVDGALTGDPQTCIAVDCVPGEFASCRGDRAIMCNLVGTDYELVQCSRGCDEAAGGCRLCDANQTVCENGTVQTCDANGAVVESEACPLGCFEDQPRCREIDPSNGLATYADMVTSPSDLDLDGVVILTETGEILKDDVPLPGLSTFLAPAAPGGVPIRVLVVRDLRMSGVTIFANELDRSGYPLKTGPAFAVVAKGTIEIAGRVVVSGGAGGVVLAGCVGGASVPEYDSDDVSLHPGPGGGAHATDGARGGEIVNRHTGAAAGQLSGTEHLAPLRGGCAGGGHGGAGNLGSAGGGALQLSSERAIEIASTIDVRGQTQPFRSGGGGGGGLLLEAPRVTLAPEARLIATGGAGGAGNSDGTPVSIHDDGLPQPGAACTVVSAYCGGGGAGAANGTPATAGASATFNSSGSCAAGGGGGGLGRIRINTPDRTYTKANNAVEAGATSVGTLGTR